jgi:hypothetical protein
MGTIFSFILSYEVYKEHNKKQMEQKLKAKVRATKVYEDIVKEGIDNLNKQE